MAVSYNDILQARQNISSYVRNTHTQLSSSFSEILKCNAYLKFENQQYTGSFKIRGATNKILSLSQEEKQRGIIASSAGNHAQGVAKAGKQLGIKVTIVMPINAPIIKIQATKAYGANVILHGEIYDDAFLHAKELAEKHNYTFVHAYEDEKVIAGQGTMGIELIEKVPDLNMLFVPVGGGGMISGIATAVKHMNPNCKIIGVQSEGVNAVSESFKAKKVIQKSESRATIADGIAVKKVSQSNFDNYISKYVDDMITVSDDEIAEAMVYLLERSKAVVEGSGAVGIAAALTGKIPLQNNVGFVLSGGNVDLNLISKVIELGLSRKGRLVQINTLVNDRPGTLSKLTSCIAATGANIMEVHHDRISTGRFLNEARIEFILETKSSEHIEEIKQSLRDQGVRIL